MNNSRHMPVKRRIPRIPRESRCHFKFEVDGDATIMVVDCIESCGSQDLQNDICWANLVRAVSSSALPDRIILEHRRPIVCDRIFVSLIRNAAIIVRRLAVKLKEYRDIGHSGHPKDVEALNDLMRAILYDVPQLIGRVVLQNSPADPGIGCPIENGLLRSESIEVQKVLRQKRAKNLAIEASANW